MSEPSQNSETDEQVFKLADTKFVGQFKHVIRLYYPCEMFEDVKGDRGEPPDLQRIAFVLARHKRECEDGCE